MRFHLSPRPVRNQVFITDTPWFEVLAWEARSYSDPFWPNMCVPKRTRLLYRTIITSSHAETACWDGLGELIALLPWSKRQGLEILPHSTPAASTELEAKVVTSIMWQLPPMSGGIMVLVRAIPWQPSLFVFEPSLRDKKII